ncbi:hypothetical protein B0H19DRAFT_1147053 [Mycena capillaripes]|nr:hypothetical protein B0H19DRAFT_1147053 [Mycena capillaripes]
MRGRTGIRVAQNSGTVASYVQGGSASRGPCAGPQSVARTALGRHPQPTASNAQQYQPSFSCACLHNHSPGPCRTEPPAPPADSSPLTHQISDRSSFRLFCFRLSSRSLTWRLSRYRPVCLCFIQTQPILIAHKGPLIQSSVLSPLSATCPTCAPLPRGVDATRRVPCLCLSSPHPGILSHPSPVPIPPHFLPPSRFAFKTPLLPRHVSLSHPLTLALHRWHSSKIEARHPKAVPLLYGSLPPHATA